MLLERDGEDDKLKSMRATTLEEVRSPYPAVPIDID